VFLSVNTWTSSQLVGCKILLASELPFENLIGELVMRKDVYWHFSVQGSVGPVGQICEVEDSML
jgi:hypothetical protein